MKKKNERQEPPYWVHIISNSFKTIQIAIMCYTVYKISFLIQVIGVELAGKQTNAAISLSGFGWIAAAIGALWGVTATSYGIVQRRENRRLEQIIDRDHQARAENLGGGK